MDKRNNSVRYELYRKFKTTVAAVMLGLLCVSMGVSAFAIGNGLKLAIAESNTAPEREPSSDMDKDTVIGWDRDGCPIYASLGLFGAGRVWGYDVTGQPIDSEPSQAGEAGRMGLPVYDYSAIELARARGDLNDADIEKIIGRRMDGTVAFGPGGQDLNALGYTADGNVIYKYPKNLIEYTDYGSLYGTGLITGASELGSVSGNGRFPWWDGTFAVPESSGYELPWDLLGNNATQDVKPRYETPDRQRSREDRTVQKNESKPIWKVTFDAAGGTDVASQDVEDGSTIKEPSAPDKEGYVFDGWYKDDSRYDFHEQVKGDMTLTAQWSPQVYAITYKLGEDAYFDTVPPSGYRTTDSIVIPEPKRPGYTFMGWTWTGHNTPEKSVNVTGSTGPLTLTAQWSPLAATVSFDWNLNPEMKRRAQLPDEYPHFRFPQSDDEGGLPRVRASYTVRSGEAWGDGIKGSGLTDWPDISPLTEVYGYRFKGWAVGSPDGPIVRAYSTATLTSGNNVTLYGVWDTAATASYRVNYWIQSLGGNLSDKGRIPGSATVWRKGDKEGGYELYSVSTGTAEANSMATPAPIEITGFATPEPISDMAVPGSETVFNYFYKRNTQAVTVSSAHNADVTVKDSSGTVLAHTAGADAQFTAPFGERIQMTAEAPEGYEITGWTGIDRLAAAGALLGTEDKKDAYGRVESSTLMFTVPALSDLRVAPIVEPIKYTIVYHSGTTAEDPAKHTINAVLKANSPSTVEKQVVYGDKGATFISCPFVLKESGEYHFTGWMLDDAPYTEYPGTEVRELIEGTWYVTGDYDGAVRIGAPLTAHKGEKVHIHAMWDETITGIKALNSVEYGDKGPVSLKVSGEVVPSNKKEGLRAGEEIEVRCALQDGYKVTGWQVTGSKSLTTLIKNLQFKYSAEGYAETFPDTAGTTVRFSMPADAVGLVTVRPVISPITYYVSLVSGDEDVTIEMTYGGDTELDPVESGLERPAHMHFTGWAEYPDEEAVYGLGNMNNIYRNGTFAAEGGELTVSEDGITLTPDPAGMLLASCVSDASGRVDYSAPSTADSDAVGLITEEFSQLDGDVGEPAKTLYATWAWDSYDVDAKAESGSTRYMSSLKNDDTPESAQPVYGTMKAIDDDSISIGIPAVREYQDELGNVITEDIVLGEGDSLEGIDFGTREEPLWLEDGGLRVDYGQEVAASAEMNGSEKDGSWVVKDYAWDYYVKDASGAEVHKAYSPNALNESTYERRKIGVNTADFDGWFPDNGTALTDGFELMCRATVTRDDTFVAKASFDASETGNNAGGTDTQSRIWLPESHGLAGSAVYYNTGVAKGHTASDGARSAHNLFIRRADDAIDTVDVTVTETDDEGNTREYTTEEQREYVRSVHELSGDELWASPGDDLDFCAEVPDDTLTGWFTDYDPELFGTDYAAGTIDGATGLPRAGMEPSDYNDGYRYKVTTAFRGLEWVKDGQASLKRFNEGDVNRETGLRLSRFSFEMGDDPVTLSLKATGGPTGSYEESNPEDDREYLLRVSKTGDYITSISGTGVQGRDASMDGTSWSPASTSAWAMTDNGTRSMWLPYEADISISDTMHPGYKQRAWTPGLSDGETLPESIRGFADQDNSVSGVVHSSTLDFNMPKMPVSVAPTTRGIEYMICYYGSSDTSGDPLSVTEAVYGENDTVLLAREGAEVTVPTDRHFVGWALDGDTGATAGTAVYGKGTAEENSGLNNANRDTAATDAIANTEADGAVTIGDMSGRQLPYTTDGKGLTQEDGGTVALYAVWAKDAYTVSVAQDNKLYNSAPDAPSDEVLYSLGTHTNATKLITTTTATVGSTTVNGKRVDVGDTVKLTAATNGARYSNAWWYGASAIANTSTSAGSYKYRHLNLYSPSADDWTISGTGIDPVANGGTFTMPARALTATATSSCTMGIPGDAQTRPDGTYCRQYYLTVAIGSTGTRTVNSTAGSISAVSTGKSGWYRSGASVALTATVAGSYTHTAYYYGTSSTAAYTNSSTTNQTRWYPVTSYKFLQWNKDGSKWTTTQNPTYTTDSAPRTLKAYGAVNTVTKSGKQGKYTLTTSIGNYNSSGGDSHLSGALATSGSTASNWYNVGTTITVKLTANSAKTTGDYYYSSSASDIGKATSTYGGTHNTANWYRWKRTITPSLAASGQVSQTSSTSNISKTFSMPESAASVTISASPSASVASGTTYKYTVTTTTTTTKKYRDWTSDKFCGWNNLNFPSGTQTYSFDVTSDVGMTDYFSFVPNKTHRGIVNHGQGFQLSDEYDAEPIYATHHVYTFTADLGDYHSIETLGVSDDPEMYITITSTSTTRSWVKQ